MGLIEKTHQKNLQLHSWSCRFSMFHERSDVSYKTRHASNGEKKGISNNVLYIDELS